LTQVPTISIKGPYYTVTCRPMYISHYNPKGYALSRESQSSELESQLQTWNFLKQIIKCIVQRCKTMLIAKSKGGSNLQKFKHTETNIILPQDDE